MVSYASMGVIPVWDRELKRSANGRKYCCALSVGLAFVVGLLVGVFVPYLRSVETSAIVQPTVSFVEEPGVVEDGIYWSGSVEAALPSGYSGAAHQVWASYVESGIAVKLERGCGRMQNRLVTFSDGSQGCVRYRQNTDQIQGELFSFYLAQILGLPNLAPSTVSVVNPKAPLWQHLAADMAAAQWNSNRPVVLTKYLPDLDPSNIPPIFRPTSRHLNLHDVRNMSSSSLVELAQWSDLIVFDYLTANLDRIVNNLYNHQWNDNIMEAPAHNLAKHTTSNLLVFLDNESGLLHGYRLLEKYEVYHALLLDNLCIFRRSTAEAVRKLKRDGNVGAILRGMFERSNGGRVKDVLPTLPDKSVRILNERLDRVHEQLRKCEDKFGGT